MPKILSVQNCFVPSEGEGNFVLYLKRKKEKKGIQCNMYVLDEVNQQKEIKLSRKNRRTWEFRRKGKLNSSLSWIRPILT